MFPDLDPTPVHQMEIRCDQNGWERWTCPVCGRTLLMQWEPFTKLVVCDGDPCAMHSAGKGLTIGATGVEQ